MTVESALAYRVRRPSRRGKFCQKKRNDQKTETVSKTVKMSAAVVMLAFL